jgi:hypothetical protein
LMHYVPSQLKRLHLKQMLQMMKLGKLNKSAELK